MLGARSRRRSTSAARLACLVLAAVGPAAGLLAAADGAAAAPRIVRGPYLQQTTARTTLVVWQTDRRTPGAVLYGARRPSERTVHARASRTLHAVRLSGLAPATSYAYRVRVGRRLTHPVRFRTGPRTSGHFRFGAIGDFGTGNRVARRHAALLRREDVDFLVTTGDNVYPDGLDAQYDAALFRPFGWLMKRISLWPSLGNHDYGDEGGMSRGTARAYFRNFVLPRRPGRERYYAFRYGNAEFLSLDTEVTPFAPGTRQYRWIEATLRRSPACWKIPYFHHPAYAEYVDPPAADVARLREVRRWLVPLFERYGVELVLDSHEHNYVRSVPMVGGRRDAGGPTYVLTGGGGAPLDPLPAAPQPLTAVRGAFFHHLVVAVSGRKLTARAIDPAGRVRDRFALACTQRRDG